MPFFLLRGLLAVGLLLILQLVRPGPPPTPVGAAPGEMEEEGFAGEQRGELERGLHQNVKLGP